jgi:hypothetical protein
LRDKAAEIIAITMKQPERNQGYAC